MGQARLPNDQWGADTTQLPPVPFLSILFCQNDQQVKLFNSTKINIYLPLIIAPVRWPVEKLAILAASCTSLPPSLEASLAKQLLCSFQAYVAFKHVISRTGSGVRHLFGCFSAQQNTDESQGILNGLLRAWILINAAQENLHEARNIHAFQ